MAAGAPVMLDYLCDDCAAHFEEVKACLTDAGLSFEVDPRIVRGLDYYTRTVFEFISDALGAQSTVCGGGRYDGLIEELGGAMCLLGLRHGAGEAAHGDGGQGRFLPGDSGVRGVFRLHGRSGGAAVLHPDHQAAPGAAWPRSATPWAAA